MEASSVQRDLEEIEKMARWLAQDEGLDWDQLDEETRREYRREAQDPEPEED